jgi:hypothetical protein
VSVAVACRVSTATRGIATALTWNPNTAIALDSQYVRKVRSRQRFTAGRARKAVA